MAENLGSKIGSAFIEVGASFIGFGQNLAADVTNAFLAQSFVVGQALENFGQAVFKKFSLPLLAATGANIAQFQALDREIRTTLTLFGTAPSLVADTFGEMASGVRDVAIEVGGLEKDISGGLYQAISAGVPRGGVFEFLDVAQMAAIADRTADVTTAVDGLTTVINAFGLESSETERIADVMFQTVAAGKTTFGELSSDIGRVAPLAANAGVAFEELFAIIGTLTLSGLKTSEAISFLRASITGVLRPTEELNEVFQAAGFASAEAAVPIIGLQEAFSIVVDAVDGSTSKLQELIGTSEGVSAMLGITGDNAESFARVMSGVENSTGAANRAFEIMDEGVGRTFGRMTEAFDRLGNTFGEMASQFAAPVLETATGILNRMVDIFSKARGPVAGLSQAFSHFMQVLEIPVLREVISIIAAMGVTIYGTIGALGLMALTFGKVILAGLQIGAVARVWTLLSSAITATSVSTQALGGSMILTAGNMKQMGVVGKLAYRPVSLLGRAFASTRFATLAAGAAFAGIGLAIGGAIAGIGHLINKQKEYVESEEVFRKGVDQLIESLGLVNQAIALEGAEEGESTLASFREENRETLKVLQDTKRELGDLAAADIAEAIAVEMVWRGNEPEDVLEAIRLIEEASGIEIDIEIGDLEDANASMQEFLEGLDVAAERLGGPRGLSAGANDVANAVATLFERSFATGDVESFAAGIDSVKESLDAIEPRKREAAYRRFKVALDEVFEEQFGFKPTGFFDPAEWAVDTERLLQQFADAGMEIEVPVETLWQGTPPGRRDIPLDPQGTTQELDTTEIERQVAERRAQAEDLGVSLETIYALVRGPGVESFEEFSEGIQGAFQTARTEVEDAFAAIEEGIQNQNPLLDIYSGAIEQSFSEWKAGHDQFQADLESVTELREQLVGDKSIPQEFVEAFDKQPISKQAWLAGLGEGNLKTALEELTDTQNLIDENAQERITQSFDGIMQGARDRISEQYGEMRNDAAEEGPVVAAAFDEAFGIEAREWAITAQEKWDELNGILSQQIPGPTVGPLQFAPNTSGGVPTFTGYGPTSTQVPMHVEFHNPTSHDATEDSRRAVGVLRTASHQGTALR